MILMVYVYDINMIICYNASSQQDKMNVIESETTALYQQNTYIVKMYVRRCTGFQHLVLNLGQNVDRQRSTTVSSLKQ